MLKRGFNNASAFGVAITGRLGSISESGFKVFKWQWSSRLCVINKQSISGRSLSCSRIRNQLDWSINLKINKNINILIQFSLLITWKFFKYFLAAVISQGIPKSKLPTKIGSTKIFNPLTSHNQLFPYKRTLSKEKQEKILKKWTNPAWKNKKPTSKYVSLNQSVPDKLDPTGFSS